MSRRKTIPRKDAVRRITGFSTPFRRIQWKYSTPERHHKRPLITFLEGRRALYVPFQIGVLDQVTASLQAIREKLPETLNASEPVRAMRAACQKFLTKPHPKFHNFPWRHHPEWRKNSNREVSLGFFVALRELRAAVGAQLAVLASGYCLDLELKLAAILPASE